MKRAKAISHDGLSAGLLMRYLREKRGMTQKELATALGYDSPQFVSLMEREQSMVPFEVLGQLSKIFDYDVRSQVEFIVRRYREKLMLEITKGVVKQIDKGAK